MKAVVLVGGEGTRLRPLTETLPKPLVPFLDRPFLDHVLDHLERHGVREVVLSSPYLEETFGPFVAARAGHPRITWITESVPLGTGGAIVNALTALDTDEPFLALNGDILTDLDLGDLAAFHRRRGARATIALTHVTDARPFGLVPTRPDGRVEEFREKPTDAIPGDVNAGTYVLDPAVFADRTPGEPCSIERDVFPALIARGEPIYGLVSDAYWTDLGTPGKYLEAHADALAGRVSTLRGYPAPWIAASASVDASARLAPDVAVGEGSRVGTGATVEGSVLHEGVTVGTGARVVGSILGPRSEVGDGATVEGCVLGEGARVAAGALARGEAVRRGD